METNHEIHHNINISCTSLFTFKFLFHIHREAEERCEKTEHVLAECESISHKYKTDIRELEARLEDSLEHLQKSVKLL